MKFKKSFEKLKKLFESQHIAGKWSEKGENQKQFKDDDGAVMNWYPSTGTLQFQGPADEKRALQSKVEVAVSSESKPAGSSSLSSSDKPRIFVVHGHDDIARDQLELVLRRLDLDPFVLMNSSGGGMTIIEALESEIGKHGKCEFGIVLMTPDDVGYAKRDGEKEAKARARQNVILETGMLLSSLTRDRVAILVKGYVELPSDASGIIYLHFNDHVKEVVPKLSERLQACGIELTAEQISRASS